MNKYHWIAGYLIIVFFYWLSLIWRFNDDYAVSYLLGWALVWPVSLLEWLF